MSQNCDLLVFKFSYHLDLKVVIEFVFQSKKPKFLDYKSLPTIALSEMVDISLWAEWESCGISAVGGWWRKGVEEKKEEKGFSTSCVNLTRLW